MISIGTRRKQADGWPVEAALGPGGEASSASDERRAKAAAEPKQRATGRKPPLWTLSSGTEAAARLAEREREIASVGSEGEARRVLSGGKPRSCRYQMVVGRGDKQQVRYTNGGSQEKQQRSSVEAGQAKQAVSNCISRQASFNMASTSAAGASTTQDPSGPSLPPNVIRLPATKQLQGIFTIIRDETTPRGEFVFYASRITRLLCEEGLNHLPVRAKLVQTPTGLPYQGAWC